MRQYRFNRPISAARQRKLLGSLTTFRCAYVFRNGFVEAATANSPTGSGEACYFGNLRAHTSYSGGSGTPNEAYTRAKNHLDFLAITEHNHEAAELGAKRHVVGVRFGRLIAGQISCEGRWPALTDPLCVRRGFSGC